MTRAASILCGDHAAVLASTRMFPADYETCRGCAAAGYGKGNVCILLPHLDQRKLAAVHEIGHAFAYQRIGVKVNYATIFPDPSHPDGWSGRVNIDLPPDDLRPLGLWGGTAAVRAMMLHQPDAPTMLDFVDLGCNGRHDAALLRRAGLTTDELFETRAAADEIAAREWLTIELIADALADRLLITGTEIGVITRAVDNI